MSPAKPSSIPLIFRPGAASAGLRRTADQCLLEIPMPWLAGPQEELIAAGEIIREEPDFLLLRHAGGLAGVALAPAGQDPYAAARQLYHQVLVGLVGQQLYRVWNYVPHINAEAGGLENYRAFNAGRHKAFIGAYGPDFAGHLPAASALGTGGDRLAVCFLAGPGPAQHFENPEQVPAFRYPAEYGPTPPSFARGTVVRQGEGGAWFLSGTASIKGHATCGSDFASQAQLTFDNVRLMFQRMNLPASASGPWKIFLRHRQDLPAAKAALAVEFPDAAPNAMFLEADICRASLLLEVEATYHQPSFDPNAGSTRTAATLTV